MKETEKEVRIRFNIEAEGEPCATGLMIARILKAIASDEQIAEIAEDLKKRLTPPDESH